MRGSIHAMKIYLDVCCLCRPMDDQSHAEVHLESEAVITILNRCQKAEWELAGSEILDMEISRIPDAYKRNIVLLLLRLAKTKILTDENVEKRAMELQSQGFKLFDALHLACAEKANVDVFLTTDEKLFKKAGRSDIIKVKVENPVAWLMEAMR